MRVFLAILGFLGSVVLIYVLWALFIPMQIGGKIVERKVLEQSPQYVITQKSALNELYVSYVKADDESVKTAIKTQICSIAVNLPQDELPLNISVLCH